ncbi:MAG: xanthine dehydrogenase family protein molybdopterin-binding subunit [Chloroflexota bacterium]
MRAVGSSLPRHDAVDKTLGTAPYPDDIQLKNQAWMKIVFADHPHARITHMDISAAKAAPGVIELLTATDVPNNEYGLLTPDQPVLCGLGSTERAKKVRWEADKIALVIAESQSQAEAAAKLIKVDYLPLPVVTDPQMALLPDAPLVDEEQETNVLYQYKIRRGDIDEAFAQAHVIVESEYHTHPQEHAYLQPESGLAIVRPDGRIEVIVAGQWMHEDRQQIAHALGLPEEQIVVRYPAIGGAFGGREDMSIQIPLALAALKTGRPVKTTWNREESIMGHHKRHAFVIRSKWAATKEGQIIAAQADLISDAGGYMYTSSKVLGNAALSALGPYQIPNVSVDARAVLTNNCPGGAFRGFGGLQGHFAAEMQVAKLAHALEMDPVALRMKNLLREGSILPTQSVVPPGCTAVEVTEEAAKHGGWLNDSKQGWHRSPQSEQVADPILLAADAVQNMSLQTSLDASAGQVARGIGLATCYKNVGFSFGFPEHCYATVELRGEAEIGQAIVGCVGADVGQGAHLAFRQIAAEVLNLEVSQVVLQADHTDITGSSGSASASRLTFMAGNAIQGAAQKALKEWEEEERPARAEFVYHPRATSAPDPETGESDPSVTYGYCAQVAQVAVDLETGHITVERLVSVNDVGKAVNPQQVEGQIEGAVAQSIGWTLLENYLQHEGRTLTAHLSNYLIPGVLDVAQIIEPIILEIPDPQGPLGIRGMAEMPMIPTAPAIAAAIHDAVGIWIDQLPITPERMWRALQST